MYGTESEEKKMKKMQETGNFVTTEDVKELFMVWKIVKKVVRKHPGIEMTELNMCGYKDKVIILFKHLQEADKFRLFYIFFCRWQLGYVCQIVPEANITAETSMCYLKSILSVLLLKKI